MNSCFYRQLKHIISTIFLIGNYSRLAIEIQFARSVGYYMLQIYIPSIMIVVMSWVSFWIDRSATTARVILAVASILTLTFLTYSTNAALPKVSYIKSIDFYLGVCLFFVFVSLLGKCLYVS